MESVPRHAKLTTVYTLMGRSLMAESPDGQHPRKSRAKVVKPGRLAVSEFAADRPGAASPFGDDITFPVPTDRLSYEHPTAE